VPLPRLSPPLLPAPKLTYGAQDAADAAAAAGPPVRVWPAAALLRAAESAAAAPAAGAITAAAAFPAEWLWWCPCPAALLGLRARVACVPLLPLDAKVSVGDARGPVVQTDLHG
jgi:hypothetical protein